MNRRNFLKKQLLGSSALALSSLPFSSSALGRQKSITILHTNDVHSHIEPFPKNHYKYPGMGGVSQRYKLIEYFREKDKNVLLFDAGDIFQGTPYFNFYKGETEIALMNEMGYDAATIGNHDFDAGIENLAERIKQANFPFLNCNYGIKNTPLEYLVKPYTIIKKNGIKIGVTGVGIQLEGLVPPHFYGEIKYHSPVEALQKIERVLYYEYQCEYIVCLSHLGFSYSSKKISDVELSKRLKFTNLIIGGHTHTFMDAASRQINAIGNEVFVTQAGWAGLQLGCHKIFFHKMFKKNLALSQTVMVSKKSIGF